MAPYGRIPLDWDAPSAEQLSEARTSLARRLEDLYCAGQTQQLDALFAARSAPPVLDVAPETGSQFEGSRLASALSELSSAAANKLGVPAVSDVAALRLSSAATVAGALPSGLDSVTRPTEAVAAFVARMAGDFVFCAPPPPAGPSRVQAVYRTYLYVGPWRDVLTEHVLEDMPTGSTRAEAEALLASPAFLPLRLALYAISDVSGSLSIVDYFAGISRAMNKLSLFFYALYALFLVARAETAESKAKAEAKAACALKFLDPTVQLGLALTSGAPGLAATAAIEAAPAFASQVSCVFARLRGEYCDPTVPIDPVVLDALRWAETAALSAIVAGMGIVRDSLSQAEIVPINAEERNAYKAQAKNTSETLRRHRTFVELRPECRIEAERARFAVDGATGVLTPPQNTEGPAHTLATHGRSAVGRLTLHAYDAAVSSVRLGFNSKEVIDMPPPFETDPSHGTGTASGAADPFLRPSKYLPSIHMGLKVLATAVEPLQELRQRNPMWERVCSVADAVVCAAKYDVHYFLGQTAAEASGPSNASDASKTFGRLASLGLFLSRHPPAPALIVQGADGSVDGVIDALVSAELVLGMRDVIHFRGMSATISIRDTHPAGNPGTYSSCVRDLPDVCSLYATLHPDTHQPDTVVVFFTPTESVPRALSLPWLTVVAHRDHAAEDAEQPVYSLAAHDLSQHIRMQHAPTALTAKAAEKQYYRRSDACE
jgi:hypothetical protein